MYPCHDVHSLICVKVNAKVLKIKDNHPSQTFFPPNPAKSRLFPPNPAEILLRLSMLSPEQHRLRQLHQLRKRQQEEELLRLQSQASPDSASDTESEPIGGTSSSHGKRVTGVTGSEVLHLHMLHLPSASPRDPHGRESERSMSPAMESFLNSSSDSDEPSCDDSVPFHSTLSSLASDDYSATVSDVLSSVSMRSSVSRRPSRSSFVSSALNHVNIEMSLKKRCKCYRKTGASCHSSFTFGDISELRYNRSKLDQSMERDLRLCELKSAEQHPDKKISVGGENVKHRMCCITSYRIAFGLPKSSVNRTLKDLRKDIEPGVIGRKKKTAADRIDDILIGPQSPMQLHAQAWLKNWLECEGDVDPTGNEQTYTIDMVEVSDIHKEYDKEWKLNALTEASKSISLRDFTRVWDHVMIDMRVRIREKKNMTTKCSGNRTYQ